MKWIKYDKQPEGFPVEGDSDVPTTPARGVIWLVNNAWKTVVVFRVSDEQAKRGFMVGFRNHTGPQRMLDQTIHVPVFRLFVGREDVTFFAVDAGSDEEIKLEFVAREDKNSGRHSSVVLF